LKFNKTIICNYTKKHEIFTNLTRKLYIENYKTIDERNQEDLNKW